MEPDDLGDLMFMHEAILKMAPRFEAPDQSDLVESARALRRIFRRHRSEAKAVFGHIFNDPL